AQGPSGGSRRGPPKADGRDSHRADSFRGGRLGENEGGEVGVHNLPSPRQNRRREFLREHNRFRSALREAPPYRSWARPACSLPVGRPRSATLPALMGWVALLPRRKSRGMRVGERKYRRRRLKCRPALGTRHLPRCAARQSPCTVADRRGPKAHPAPNPAQARGPPPRPLPKMKTNGTPGPWSCWTPRRLERQILLEAGALEP